MLGVRSHGRLGRRLAGALAFGVVLALPGAAHAAELTLRETYAPMPQLTRPQDRIEYMGYRAAPGEVNDLTVFRDGDAIVVRDPGAVIAAPAACAPVGSGGHELRCDVPNVTLVNAFLEDGDDRADVRVPTAMTPTQDAMSFEGPSTWIRGGDGDDRLRGSALGVHIDAEGGDDVVELGPGEHPETYPESVSALGGDGADTITVVGDEIWMAQLKGDAGPDLITMASGGLMTEFIQGGPGDDVIHGGDIDETDGGKSRKHPSGQPMSTIRAGYDELIGNEGNDTIYGYRGTNVLDGSQGNDTLYGGPGEDHFRGNEGDDTIFGGDGADRFFCYESENPDNCGERLLIFTTSGRLASDGTVGVTVRCGSRRGRTGSTCSGSAAFTTRALAGAQAAAGTQTIGRRFFRARPGSTKTVRVKVSPTARRAARARSGLRSRAVISVRARRLRDAAARGVTLRR